jgi:hypothetical protein
MKIKALVFGFVLAALAFGQASAQKFNLGVEGGANFANFIGSSVSANSLTGSRLGLVGGGFLELNFGNSFAIRPELLYSQKGGKDTSNNTYQLDYVEVPVLVKLSLGTPGINPGILLGPSFSWNTVAQVASSNGGASQAIQNVDTSDIGFIIGAELDIDKFFATGRYELGFNNIVNAVSGGTTNNNVQNGLVTLMVGYSFM